jgi:hypothetical protein
MQSSLKASSSSLLINDYGQTGHSALDADGPSMARTSPLTHSLLGVLVPKLRSAALFVATLLGVGVFAFAVGFVAGKVLHDPHDAARSHAAGACIALEMAAAHGAIDELERRMTLRALASALNPHFERFPDRATEISSMCDKLTKGAVSGKVAR